MSGRFGRFTQVSAYSGRLRVVALVAVALVLEAGRRWA
jgi:hypothetical protein